MTDFVSGHELKLLLLPGGLEVTVEHYCQRLSGQRSYHTGNHSNSNYSPSLIFMKQSLEQNVQCSHEIQKEIVLGNCFFFFVPFFYFPK